MEMLATQCPRLRRLSGRAAALSFRTRMVGGLRPPSPGPRIFRGDDPPIPPEAGFARKPGVGSLLTPRFNTHDACGACTTTHDVRDACEHP